MWMEIPASLRLSQAILVSGPDGGIFNETQEPLCARDHVVAGAYFCVWQRCFRAEFGRAQSPVSSVAQPGAKSVTKPIAKPATGTEHI